ncbi:MAG: fumarylacetoacetate hydrolase family protein [Sandaracinaceae bacterium]|nr:fumarylacetoacetate hydrolase family protein [Sandaracinaceae bacterium]
MRVIRLSHSGINYFARLVDDATAQLWTAAPWLGGTETDRLVPVRSDTLLAPVAPSKILCVGRNYRAHAQELGNDVPTEPLLFLKPPSSLLGPGASIALPPQSARVEHEGEVGIVIGSELRNATADQARKAIFGFTCVNDVTARDLQKKDVQFTRAKGFDTFCPVGPCVETDLTPDSLRVITRVNGAVRQDGNTRDMVFPIDELLAFMSHIMTLAPGDLIVTGTPAGVGPLVHGDRVDVEVEGVGVLSNAVTHASAKAT